MDPLAFLVHGYDHDPDIPKHDPENGIFPIFREMLTGYATKPLAWHSGLIFNYRDVLSAWSRGYRSTYTWAYGDLSKKAAQRLIADARIASAPRWVLCHSLGARVVLLAIRQQIEINGGTDFPLFQKVVIFNGAETVRVADPIIRAAQNTEFLNLCVEEDDVLDKCAGWFSPRIFGKEEILGQDGIKNVPGNLTQIFLDDEKTQKKYKTSRGWGDLQGDNSKSIGDHWYSYRHRGNWPLVRSFLEGDL